MAWQFPAPRKITILAGPLLPGDDGVDPNNSAGDNT
jgi:hypothetical protein